MEVERTHLLGWRELNKLEAELNLDLLPGVVGPDLGVVLLDLPELPLGVDVAGTPAAGWGVVEVDWGECSSLLEPLDFLLDFLLDTLFRFNISESLMGGCGVESGDSLDDAPSSLDLCLKCSGNMLAKDDPAMVQDLPGTEPLLLPAQDIFKDPSSTPSLPLIE